MNYTASKTSQNRWIFSRRQVWIQAWQSALGVRWYGKKILSEYTSCNWRHLKQAWAFCALWLLDIIMPSILVDTQADMLLYGMSETQIKTAHGLAKGWPIQNQGYPRNLLYEQKSAQEEINILLSQALKRYQLKRLNLRAFQIQSREQNPFIRHHLVQKHGDLYLVQLPPINHQSKWMNFTDYSHQNLQDTKMPGSSCPSGSRVQCYRSQRMFWWMFFLRK